MNHIDRSELVSMGQASNERMSIHDWNGMDQIGACLNAGSNRGMLLRDPSLRAQPLMSLTATSQNIPISVSLVFRRLNDTLEITAPGYFV
jgi:23S rRNA A2030 N6-methylase RlmJ